MSARPAFALTADEKERFERDGWIGPFDLLGPAEAGSLEPELARCFGLTRGYFYPPGVSDGDSHYTDARWFQSLHTLSAELAAVGRRDEIVGRVASLLGNDLLQWAGIRFEQSPGRHLHWHTDTEYDYWSGVSAWMGVTGTTPETALKIVPGSHRLPVSPEDLIADHGFDYASLADDQNVLEWLADAFPDLAAAAIRVPVHNGQFVLFNGKLWHASDNPGTVERVAMGMRYTTPDQHIRIPLTYEPPVIFDTEPAPCVLVSGHDHIGVNHLVEPPRPN